MTKKPAIIIIALFSWFLITGCEPFEPLQENERHFFSVNGVLDASADTQWVRVMPVRESLNMEPGLPVPAVTLQHPESGDSVTMNDSLVDYRDGRYAYLFWTTMEVHPEQTYHLTVEGDGQTSRAEATLPEDFPVPEFRNPEFNGDILLVEQVKHLADVQVIYRLRFDGSGEIFEWVFPHLQNSAFIPPDTYRASINAGTMRTKIIESYCGFTVTERTVFVAAGGPDWPDFISLDKYTVTLPDGDYSNIENGVGFFGGIISKTFPYVDASGNDGLNRVPCTS
ncbi:MAG: hypothetical protein WEA56_10410 [Balneolaceae bacterium]